MLRFMKLEGENVLLRIFLDTSVRWHHRPLYEALVEMARSEHLAGATVFEGVEGFGQGGHVLKSSAWHIVNPREVVVEIVDSAEKTRSFLAAAEPMLGDAVVTMERARVIHYRTKGKQLQ